MHELRSWWHRLADNRGDGNEVAIETECFRQMCSLVARKRNGRCDGAFQDQSVARPIEAQLSHKFIDLSREATHYLSIVRV
jgi:hypothetical protein